MSRLIAEAHEDGGMLGFVSTTSRANIEAIAAGVKGLSLEQFDVVTSAADVTNSKPDPEVYTFARHKLGIRPENTAAIEDTTLSLQAARAAKIICIATPGDYTREQDFSEAQAVFEQLGTDNEPSNVIRTEFAFEQNYVDIDWLSKLLQKSQGIFA